MVGARDNPTPPCFPLGTHAHCCMTGMQVCLRLPFRSVGGLTRPHSVPGPGWIPIPRPSWAIPPAAQLTSCPRGGTRPSTARLQHLWHSSPLQVRCASKPQRVPSEILSARTPTNATNFRRVVSDRRGVPIDRPPLPRQNATRGPAREGAGLTRHKRERAHGGIATAATNAHPDPCRNRVFPS